MIDFPQALGGGNYRLEMENSLTTLIETKLAAMR